MYSKIKCPIGKSHPALCHEGSWYCFRCSRGPDLFAPYVGEESISVDVKCDDCLYSLRPSIKGYPRPMFTNPGGKFCDMYPDCRKDK